jgi:RNA polymerase sigma factor (sigma-70 family)
MPSLELTSDAELVAATLAGNRNAFGKIVERYQRLLCSLAYSATGQLGQSEDLAQDTFVDAWRQLANLREPEKLRPWLCGILRFKVSRLRRADGREPVRRAEALEAAEEIASADQPAADLAIDREEQALMWSALARIPESYREPLILYYREGRSIEHVAAALELTEDNVKQRLSRGRKILQEEVLTFVEGALARSTPGHVFTIAVLAALPALGTPAKVAGVGVAAAAHGGMLAKTTALATLLASASGVVSTVMTLRANLDQSRTPRERRAVVKITVGAFFGATGFIVLLYSLRTAAFRWWEHRVELAIIVQILVLAGIVAWSVLLVRAMRRMRALRSTERREHPELFSDPADRVGSSAGEYRSAWTLFGVPLVRIRFASPDEGEPPVFAWFAGGDRAYGLVAAWGGFAMAPFSIGAICVGLVAIGNVSLGVISIGTIGIGLLTVGAMSVGVKAYAWLSALGWHTAQSGGFAIARIAAEGPIALAQHANDPIARQILAEPNAERNHMVILTAVVLLSLMPVIYYARAVRRRLGSRARDGSSG